MIKKTDKSDLPISEVEVSKLLKEANTKKISDLDFGGWKSAAYRLCDGRVLFVIPWNKKGILYQSEAEFRAILSRIDETGRSYHLLEGRFPFRDEFIDRIPQLIERLSESISVELSTLDKSVESAEAIDLAVRSIGPEAFLTPDLFPCVVAYIGEVMKEAVGGRWVMQPAEGGTILEPWIEDGRGRRYAPFIIFRELAEYEDGYSSLRGIVSAHITR